MNKPLSVAGLSEDNAQGSKAKGHGQMGNFEDNLSAEGIILRYTASRKGVHTFILQHANALRSFLHILWIFSCFLVRNCQPAI